MKKKLTLKKEAIVSLEQFNPDHVRGGTTGRVCVTKDPYDPQCQKGTYNFSCESPEICNFTQAGGGGARAAGSCGSCGQPTCDGQYSSVPYDCAPTDGGNSCNFPNGCALPSVGCAQ